MRRKFILIFTAIFFVSCTKNFSSIETLEDLNGKRIGVQIGTTSEQIVQNKIEKATIVQFATGEEASIALQEKKIDAIIIDELPAKSIVARCPKLRIAENPVGDEEYAIAVKKGNKELLDSVNKTITESKKDGTYRKLVNSFISVEGKIHTPLPSPADPSGELLMGTNAAFPPFEYFENGKIIGFDISLGELIANDMNKKLELVDQPFDALIPSLISGSIDFIAAGLSTSEDRKNVVDFSLPYYKSHQVIVTRK